MKPPYSTERSKKDYGGKHFVDLQENSNIGDLNSWLSWIFFLRFLDQIWRLHFVRDGSVLKYFTGFKVIHTYKEGNSCADSLARPALLNGSAVLL
ncbi:uncharacterized protein G2W53_017495 [Senna tora]|uniref:Uncharacterized protein n=1 Tax=Senna tora TaxID=362788 RepID=A0A834TSX4_9FABA|nr:uncharacterized protein G2W53_017495 [Senna tora]